MNNIQFISQIWQQFSPAQQKPYMPSQPTCIKLNNKKKPLKLSNQNSKISDVNTSSKSNEEIQQRNIISKLRKFIQKMQETLKKILQQKDVKWYIQYAKASEAQLMDSITNSLDKFKHLTYTIMEQLDSSQKIGQKIEKQNNSTDKQQKKINYDILEFVLQYFQDHMIPETHWSKTVQRPKNCYHGLGSYWRNWTWRGSHKNNIKNVQDNLSSLKIKHTLSKIEDQMQKQEKKLSQSQEFIQVQENKLLLKPIKQTLNAILKIQDLKPIQEMSATEKIAYLFDLESKIYVSSEFVQSAAFFIDDITTLPKQKFKNVWKFIHQNKFGNEDTINQQYKLLKRLMIVTNASVIRQLQTQNLSGSWFKKIIFGLSFPIYYMNYNKAKFKNHKFLRKPTINTIKSIWNLPENGFLKQIKTSLLLEYIKTNIQFYVPRTKSTNLKNYKNRKYDNDLDIFKPNQNFIKVRLLNYKEFDKNKSESFDTILIHFHGGGFIALSSCTSQSYTRKWANTLKIPVFSVDYGKPPEYRFPVPLLDCLQVYIFISTQIHKYFNIKPKRIFVAGDSAGGNLACSVTGLALRLDLIKPEGLFLAYPAVDTRTNFTPSRINSFNDCILYPTLLLLCMRQYLGQNEQNQHNPLASPILLTQGFVNNDDNDNRWPLQWPKTIIAVGKKDPLFDDSLRLCEKLQSSGIQFHCELYTNLSHAFLSIDKMVIECNEAIKDSIKFLEKLISGQKIGKQKLL